MINWPDKGVRLAYRSEIRRLGLKEKYSPEALQLIWAAANSSEIVPATWFRMRLLYWAVSAYRAIYESRDEIGKKQIRDALLKASRQTQKLIANIEDLPPQAEDALLKKVNSDEIDGNLHIAFDPLLDRLRYFQSKADEAASDITPRGDQDATRFNHAKLFAVKELMPIYKDVANYKTTANRKIGYSGYSPASADAARYPSGRIKRVVGPWPDFAFAAMYILIGEDAEPNFKPIIESAQRNLPNTD